MSKLHCKKTKRDPQKAGISSKKLLRHSVLLLLFVALLPQAIMAQTPRTSERLTLTSLNQFLAALPVNHSETLRVKSLLKDLQPSVYLRAGVTNNYGDEPVCLFTDVSSINLIQVVDEQHRNTVELITININESIDLNGNINMSLFSVFPNLKYIYIISSVDTTPRKITNMFSQVNSQFKVFYNILKAS